MKYPDITVQLTKKDGNAFSIVGSVIRALKFNGVSIEECNIFRKEALSDDYNKVLRTAIEWVNVT